MGKANENLPPFQCFFVFLALTKQGRSYSNALIMAS